MPKGIGKFKRRTYNKIRTLYFAINWWKSFCEMTKWNWKKNETKYLLKSLPEKESGWHKRLSSVIVAGKKSFQRRCLRKKYNWPAILTEEMGKKKWNNISVGPCFRRGYLRRNIIDRPYWPQEFKKNISGGLCLYLWTHIVWFGTRQVKKDLKIYSTGKCVTSWWKCFYLI